MKFTSGIVAALAAPGAYAGMLRFACSQLVVENLDPVVNPGSPQSPHNHQIVGGNAFNASMPAGDVSVGATCTSCTFSENFSNYWTAALYFKAKNGTYKRVPTMANQFLESANGGVTVYYVTPDDKNVNITAFKPGFRMLIGEANRRTLGPTSFVNSYRCYDAKNFQPNPSGVVATDTTDFPKKHCPGGIRVATFFPNCWDGKNLDTPNHQSHVAYGYTSSCPASHPVQLPQVFIETVWDTGRFDKSLWPDQGQPFLWSQNDATGYGGHADYVFGWKGDSLQKAMNARCDVFNCPQLKSQSQATANRCIKKPMVNDIHQDINAWVTKVPGTVM